MSEGHLGWLRERGEGQAEVRPVELFFDLVYVLAVTQLTHHLLAPSRSAARVRRCCAFVPVARNVQRYAWRLNGEVWQSGGKFRSVASFPRLGAKAPQRSRARGNRRWQGRAAEGASTRPTTGSSSSCHVRGRSEG